MKIEKEGQSHRSLVLPVALILIAAFLATSLSIGGKTAITGAVTGITGQQIIQPIASMNNCKWFQNKTYGVTSTNLLCPYNYPKIASGGCSSNINLGKSLPLILPGSPADTHGWQCSGGLNFTGTGNAEINGIAAYCCKYNS